MPQTDKAKQTLNTLTSGYDEFMKTLGQLKEIPVFKRIDSLETALRTVGCRAIGEKKPCGRCVVCLNVGVLA